MKKFFFFAAIAAIGLASCSNDETIASQATSESNAISFRPLVSGVTRAASTSDVTTANIASFKVTAFRHGQTTDPYIDDVEFTGSGDPKVFTSTNKYYWPASGNLDFFAYSGAVAPQVAKVAYNSFTFTPPTAENSAYADLVFATNQDVAKTSTGVPLNFRHTASKIAVKVKNSSTSMKFFVDGWKVGYLDGTGTFTLSETTTATNNGGTLALGDWSNNTEKAVGTQYSSTFSAVSIAASASEADLDGEMILVPQRITAATAYANSGSPAANDKLNGSFIAIKLKIMNNDNNSTVIADNGAGGTIWAIWPIGDDGTTTFNWEPGKKYTYTVDLAGGGYFEENQDETTVDADLDPILDGAVIKFVSVTVDDWVDYDGDSSTDGTQPIPVDNNN